MSGRPSRNCKRRTASEMLGKSPSASKDSNDSKSAAKDSTPTQPAKKAKYEVKGSAQAAKRKSAATITATKEAESRVEQTAEPSSESVNLDQSLTRRSSRRNAVKNTLPVKLAVTKLPKKGKGAANAVRGTEDVQSSEPEVKIDLNPASMSEVETVQNPVSEVETVKTPVSEVEIVQNPVSEVETVQNPVSELETVQNPVSEVETVQNPVSEVETGQNPVSELETVQAVSEVVTDQELTTKAHQESKVESVRNSERETSENQKVRSSQNRATETGQSPEPQSDQNPAPEADKDDMSEMETYEEPALQIETRDVSEEEEEGPSGVAVGKVPATQSSPWPIKVVSSAAQSLDKGVTAPVTEPASPDRYVSLHSDAEIAVKMSRFKRTIVASKGNTQRNQSVKLMKSGARQAMIIVNTMNPVVKNPSSLEKADTQPPVNIIVGKMNTTTGIDVSDDVLTVSDGKQDKHTIPECIEDIAESSILSLRMQEVNFAAESYIAEKPKPKRLMVIAANPAEGVTSQSSESTVTEAHPAAEQGGLVMSIANDSDIIAPDAEMIASEADIITAKADAEPDMTLYPVTKTYIVGKNNRIQELLVEPSAAKSSTSTGDNPEKEEEFQAAESDDEEFEHEDEDVRIDMEGIENDDAVLFSEKLPNNYTIDELMFSMFERIKPTDDIHAHFSLDTESLLYKCIHCAVLDEAMEINSKRDMMRHLKSQHLPDFAPWQCPICQFKCIYPVSLMLHMSMHTKNKPFKCDSCNKKFAYKQKLELHLKHHNTQPSILCTQNLCKLGFYTEDALNHHVAIRHMSEPIYQGDNKAIIQEGDTSLGDALDMLVGNDEGDNSGEGADSKLYSIERGSIKISDVGPFGEERFVGSNGSNAHMPISVVADSDMIGNPNSVVQIMPVSFRNESGMPETINVVITVPPGDGVKMLNTTNTMPTVIGTALMSKSSGMSSADYSAKTRMNSVDKELLEYCTVLEQPIHYRNQRAFIMCKVCPQGMEIHFGSVTQFCEHLRKDHADRNIKPYQCTQCDYKCRVKGNLDQHVKFHSKERPFLCSICNKGFIQRYKLNLHLKFHENKRDHTCVECGSSFNDKQDLSRHMKNVHFKKEEGVKCPHCERYFKNDYMLSQHIHTHTGERNYKCDICEKLYSTKESLRSHMKGHQFQFGCEICAKPLGSYSAFIAHKRLHDPNQKGYQCEHCGKVLLFKATLEAHIKSVHSDEKDFMCESCDKGFKTQAQLNNHMISHSKDKPYLCQICGYAVKRKDSLRQHMYRHAEVKPYRCGRCGKEYTQKQALEIHLKSKHAGVTTFNCTMCDKGFNTNYLLKKHMQKAHEVELISKMPRSDQVIIAQQEMEETADSEPPAPDNVGILPPLTKKQTVLINAHICEHCHEVFVSQHALAVHILSEHMNQSRVNGGEDDATNVPTNVEDGQVINISETIEIPIGEEMVLVQSVEPGILHAALEQGASRVITSPGGTMVKQTSTTSQPSTTATASVSLLANKTIVTSAEEKLDEMDHIVVTDATVEDGEEEVDGMRIIEVTGSTLECDDGGQTSEMVEEEVVSTPEQEVEGKSAEANS